MLAIEGKISNTSINIFSNPQLTNAEIIALTAYRKNCTLPFKSLFVKTMYFINKKPITKVIRKHTIALSVYAEKVKLIKYK
jgi:hypothetical protein